MVRVAARHILVSSEDECEKIKSKILEGEGFADLAREYSQCPSGEQGGELGEFSPGEMVPEFDAVVFEAEIGKVHGPIKTQFGYHLVEVLRRTR